MVTVVDSSNWVSPLKVGAETEGVTLPLSPVPEVPELEPPSLEPFELLEPFVPLAPELCEELFDPEVFCLVSTRSLTFMKEAFFFSIFDERLLTSVRLGAKQRNRPLMLTPRLKSDSLSAPVLLTER